MRLKIGIIPSFLMLVCTWALAQPVAPTQKLGVFVGKWQTEGSFTNAANPGSKISTELECRWSPRQDFLICEQLVKMAGAEHLQLTVYSYNAEDKNYSYTTIADPGARPTSGRVDIKGNLWTYNSSFERNGKVVHLRTTNEFTDPKTEAFKVESSEDGGGTWVTLLQGTAHKIGE